MPVFIDRAVTFNPVTRRCDRAFTGRDGLIDATPQTPLLLAIGLDRRARPDDELPSPVPDVYAPPVINPRRGWWGDFLDPLGRLVGSRMWLLTRRKQTEATRRFAEAALTEVIQPLADARGWSPTVTVRWVAWQVLGWRVDAGNVTIALNQATGP